MLNGIPNAGAFQIATPAQMSHHPIAYFNVVFAPHLL
jgi:hypothetical protein